MAHRRKDVASASAGAIALALSLTSPRAMAQDELAAEALFEEGRALLAAGNDEEACRKFAASQRAAPAVGTLLNWGDCLERTGKTASAWLRFREATALAASTGQAQRERVARTRAENLAPRLCKTSLDVESPSPALVILRDGAVVEPDAWTTAVPLDPGVHEIVAKEPARAAWSTRITIGTGPCAGPQVVRVPNLVSTLTSEPARPAREKGGWRTQHSLAAASLGVGALSFGVAGVLAVDARSTYVDARDTCTPACDAEAASRSRSALREADAATVMLTVGVASTVLAAVLWLTAPHP